MDSYFQNLRDRIDRQTEIIERLQEENRLLREENERFRDRLIAFTGKDPR